MSRTERTEKKIQFQLSWSGLAVVAISTVCVLLWAFVLGFWSGKKVAEKNAAMLVAAQQATQTSQTASAGHTGGPSPIEQDQQSVGKPEAQPLAPENKENKEAQQPQIQQPSGQPQEAQETKEAPAAQKAPASAVLQGVNQASTGQEAAPPQATQAKNESVSKMTGKEAKASEETNTPPKSAKTAKEGHEAHEAKEVVESKHATKVAAVKPAVTKQQAAESKPKTKAETKPEVKPEVENGGSYYALQIGAFKEKKHAELEVVKLDAKGYKAQIRVTDTGSPNGTLHRVYLGRFKTPEEAKAFAKTLHNKDGIDSYVILIKE